MVVGVASEAGIWRQPGRNGLYRQTWVSGAHPPQAATPLDLTITVTFDDNGSYHARTFHLAPGARWALNLDDLRSPLPGVANATITIRGSAPCAATVAMWFGPIERGAVPTVYAVPFVCVEETTP